MKKLLLAGGGAWMLWFFVVAAAVGQPSPSAPAVWTGRIVSEKGEGVPYASVAVVDARQKIAAATVCQRDGRFELANVPPGTYTLEISCIGYGPGKYEISPDGTKTALGDFSIREGVEIDDIVVSAERQLVTSEVDRLVYDVENDPDAARSTALQILGKVPFVQVDKFTRQIRVMGQDKGFAITVDGKKNLLLSQDNQYVAKLLQAGKLKRIELITSPDGQYSRETAVINIVTKSPLADGVVGEISVWEKDEVSLMQELRLTSKAGKLIYNLAYSYRYEDLYGSKEETQRTDFTNPEYRFVESFVRESPGAASTHKANFGASYDFTPHDLLTLHFETELGNTRTRIASQSRYRSETGETTRELTSQSRNKTDRAAYKGSLDYQRTFENKPGRLLTLTYGFDTRKNEMEYDLSSEEAADGNAAVRQRTQNDLDNFEHTAALDFYNPISNRHSYYFTAKYVHRDYGSDSRGNDLAGETPAERVFDRLDYVQQVGSLLGNYSFRTQKLMLRAEAAFEYTRNDIRFGTGGTPMQKDDRTLYAELNLTWRPGEKSSLIFSLSRETFRPDIVYLNPYEDTSVPGLIRKGNPDLDNETRYFGSLIYRFFLHRKLSLFAIVTGAYSDNAVQSYSYTDGAGNLVTSYDNIARQKTAMFNLRMTYNPAPWLELEALFHAGYREFAYPGNRNSNWEQSYAFSLRSDLWKGGTLGVYADYRNPFGAYSENIQYAEVPVEWMGSIRLGQKIGRRLQVYVGVNNPWETYTRRTIREAASDFSSRRVQTVLGRTVSFSASCTFGGFDQSVKEGRRAVRNADRQK